ncbi:MAG TPA: methyl-accepting chemotaxis protein [Phycisphaerae bacterium]|nr:methyl-accepting chemotaxis protein [Phycisphaerae bacterium]HPM23059.1 methyl-accepting chemotaxis protein [Phycisphaerae bacterium]
MTLGKKIVTSKLTLVAVPIALLTFIAVYQSTRGFDRAQEQARTAFQSATDAVKQSLEAGSVADLEHQATATYDMCVAMQEVLEQKLKSDLNVARDVLRSGGAVALASETVTWNAVNQVTNEAGSVALPVLRIGDTPLAQNADPQTKSPVVDTVRELVKSTCTIFQRMNSAGDMLRVCTNVLKKDGQRAIGTFIPARGADGNLNPVVATLLRGETYIGRAFVVDRWYITAYEPIQDADGEVIGALYVGIPQESATSLRKAIMATKVGKSGYIFVLNGTGNTRGHYVISQGGKRDGENIWDAQDANGQFFIRTLCETAVQLKPGQIAEMRYPWKNADDPAPREKIVKVSYFQPWDWVIGVGAYIDELDAATRAAEMDVRAAAALSEVEQTKRHAQSGVVAWCIGTGVAALVIAALIGIFVTRSITRPVNRIIIGLTEGADQVNDAAAQVANAAQTLAAGNSEQASSLEETSSALEQMAAMTRTNAENAKQANELAAQARTNAANGDKTMQQLNTAMGAINESSSQISKIIKVIEEIAFQTNLLALNAAVEAARAGEHGKGFAVVAEEVRNLAQRSAQAARDTTNLIEGSVTRAKEGTSVADAAGKALQAIVADVTEVADLLNGIRRASDEQAQGVEQINAAVSQVDKVTQHNAASAEESASAAEQLNAQSNALRGLVRELAALAGNHHRSRAGNCT